MTKENSVGTKGHPCPTCGWPYVKPAPESEMTEEEIRELAAKEYEVAISRVLDILEIIANEIGR